MVDVFQDVGLSLVHIACSYQDHNTGDLKQQNCQASCPPCDADTHISESSSSEKKNKRWNSQNADSNDYVSDSLANNQSAHVLPNEPTPSYDSVKQAVLGKKNHAQEIRKLLSWCRLKTMLVWMDAGGL
uniref:Uncharacterized protein n=1 Tax=Arundo donax TaxID=35708 RepID=A0A0A8XYW0_ARUDO